jgi:ankyrin repeat protein
MVLALVWDTIAFCGEIHDAAGTGNLIKVKALLKGNPALVLSRDERGLTPLHWTVLNDETEVAKLLLANHADVNAQDNDGRTPLHRAADGHRDMVELLLANHANVNVRDDDRIKTGHICSVVRILFEWLDHSYVLPPTRHY